MAPLLPSTQKHTGIVDINSDSDKTALISAEEESNKRISSIDNDFPSPPVQHDFFDAAFHTFSISESPSMNVQAASSWTLKNPLMTQQEYAWREI